MVAIGRVREKALKRDEFVHEISAVEVVLGCPDMLPEFLVVVDQAAIGVSFRQVDKKVVEPADDGGHGIKIVVDVQKKCLRPSIPPVIDLPELLDKFRKSQ